MSLRLYPLPAPKPANLAGFQQMAGLIARNRRQKRLMDYETKRDERKEKREDQKTDREAINKQLPKVLEIAPQEAWPGVKVLLEKTGFAVDTLPSDADVQGMKPEEWNGFKRRLSGKKYEPLTREQQMGDLREKKEIEADAKGPTYKQTTVYLPGGGTVSHPVVKGEKFDPVKAYGKGGNPDQARVRAKKGQSDKIQTDRRYKRILWNQDQGPHGPRGQLGQAGHGRAI